MPISVHIFQLAFITDGGKGHFIVHDQTGAECQRFFLHHHWRYNQFAKANPLSLYHLSDYSFEKDLIYLGLNNFYFIVLPQVKRMSFIGYMTIHELPMYISSHIMKNTSLVWLLGGTNGYMPRFEVLETKIINLE